MATEKDWFKAHKDNNLREISGGGRQVKGVGRCKKEKG